MSTIMSTSKSNYTDMSIWKKHADHSTTNQRQRRRCLLQAVCATAVGAKIKPVVEATLPAALAVCDRLKMTFHLSISGLSVVT